MIEELTDMIQAMPPAQSPVAIVIDPTTRQRLFEQVVRSEGPTASRGGIGLDQFMGWPVHVAQSRIDAERIIANLNRKGYRIIMHPEDIAQRAW